MVIEWVKGTYWNPWKNIFLELSSFTHLVHCVVGKVRKRTFEEDLLVGYSLFCFGFPRSYHLSFSQPFIYDFLVWSGNSVSFLFGFHCSLFDRKRTRTQVVSLLSFIQVVTFRMGRRDFCIWGGFYASFFWHLLNPSPISE